MCPMNGGGLRDAGERLRTRSRAVVVVSTVTNYPTSSVGAANTWFAHRQVETIEFLQLDPASVRRVEQYAHRALR
jgi:hypothetical protein